MRTILLGTQNQGKIKEIKEIFSGSKFTLLNFIGVEEIPNVIEDGKTFEDNAKKKAVEYYNYFRVPVLTDDSGLEVEQLGGMPGVISARYSGENGTDETNNIKLIKELEKYPSPHLAQFVCCAVYFDGKKFITAYGSVKGQIISEPRGKNGFGYDPLFLPDGYDITSAEMTLKEKNKISHRAKAFERLKNKLTEILLK